MEGNSTFFSIRIIRISALFLALLAPTQRSVTGALGPERSGHFERLVVRRLSASISEEAFWLGSSLPRREAVVLYSESTGSSASGNAQWLAIVPSLNSTYRLRLCGRTLVLQEGAGISPRIAPDKYLGLELTRFSTLISHAKRSDAILDLTTNPAILFRGNAKFKARRISQIRTAATGLFHKHPLQIVIGDFSPSSRQIYTIIPALHEMVIFSVVDYPCGTPETVEVGKEYSLSSTRSSLLNRIEKHSTVTTIR